VPRVFGKLPRATTMTHTTPLTAAVLVIALVATAGTSAAKTQQQRDRCARTGSVTLIATKLVRVYRDRHTTFDATVYACHRPTGRATQLGLVLPQSLYQYGGVRATAVRGSTVGYGLKGDPGGDEGGPGYTIAMVKLPFRGQAVEDAPQFFADDTVFSNPTADDALAVERIVIAPNHTIAYTTCTTVNGEPDRCIRPVDNPRVVTLPYDPATQHYTSAIVLDQSPDLDPRSLRLSPSGTRLAWNDGKLKRIVPTP
jgi:hypothetical protein